MVHAHIDQRSSYESRKKHSQTVMRDSFGTFQNLINYSQGTKVKEQAAQESLDLLIEGSAPSLKDSRLNAYATASNFDRFYRGSAPHDHSCITNKNN